jgi:hypothetical protein
MFRRFVIVAFCFLILAPSVSTGGVADAEIAALRQANAVMGDLIGIAKERLKEEASNDMGRDGLNYADRRERSQDKVWSMVQKIGNIQILSYVYMLSRLPYGDVLPYGGHGLDTKDVGEVFDDATFACVHQIKSIGGASALHALKDLQLVTHPDGMYGLELKEAIENVERALNKNPLK